VVTRILLEDKEGFSLGKKGGARFVVNTGLQQGARTFSLVGGKKDYQLEMGAQSEKNKHTRKPRYNYMVNKSASQGGGLDLRDR